MLVDVVSRNGNLLLNFPLPNNGQLNSTELNILSELTAWMNINGEAIYGTRPWKIFGEGPSATAPASADAKFNESKRMDLTSDDIRFTTKSNILYAFIMGVPEQQATVSSLAQTGDAAAPRIQNIELLGAGNIPWIQGARGLEVRLPEAKPAKYAVALKITF